MSKPDSDRILVAQLTGEARHHAKWRELTEAEEAAAVAELRELAAGRADLWPRSLGSSKARRRGSFDQPLARQAAHLCRKAGADLAPILAWAEIGRARRANAMRPPFSDPHYRRPGRP